MTTATVERRVTFADVATDYARAVVGGEIPASRLTVAACSRHLADLDRVGRTDFAYRFDVGAVQRVCLFAQLMPHIKGEWANRKETIRLEPWQVFVLGSIFGWVNVETGARRFRTAYLEVPRKNAKSTLGEVIMLYMTVLDGEEGAECYSAATTRDQAGIVLNGARQMALKSPEFRQRFGVIVEKFQIVVPSTNSVAKAITRESSANEGLSPHLGLNDELHAHKSSDVYEVLDLGRGARLNSLLLSITTAGADLAGICYEVRTMIVGILEGYLASAEMDRVFGLIYTIDEDDDPHDPSSWRKANPNLGVSVYEDEFANAHAQATTSAARWNQFLTKRLNVWVRAGAPWFNSEALRTRCISEPLRRRAERRRVLIRAGRTPRADDIPAAYDGRRCYVGIDLATRRDIAAMVAVFPEHRVTEAGEPVIEYTAFGRYYLPEVAIQDARTAAYSGWVRNGWVTVTPGETTDFAFIKRDLIAWRDRFDIREVPFDPRDARQLATEMLNEHGLEMLEFAQSYATFNEAMRELDAAIVGGRFHFNGDPVLQWAMSNVTAKTGALEDVMPAKESPQSKIDPAVATLEAVARAMLDDGSGGWVVR